MTILIKDAMGTNHPKAHNPKGVVSSPYPNQLVGIELEIENTNSWDGWHHYASTGELGVLGNLGFYTNIDNSLRGTSAEYVTRPMRIDHTLFALTEFFRVTGYGPNNYSDRCSVHVHANCTDMTLEQVATLALLYSVVEEPLFEFIGNYRDTNIYCVPWYQCRNHTQVVFNCLKDPSKMRGWQKYTALNLLPLTTQGTVEFRQMHGTADIVKLTQWINIIGAIMTDAKRRDLAGLKSELEQLNTTSQYHTFFEQTLGNQLVYNPVYAEKLERGIIQAKYSLMSRETPAATAVRGAVPFGSTPELDMTVANRQILTTRQPQPRPSLGHTPHPRPREIIPPGWQIVEET